MYVYKDKLWKLLNETPAGQAFVRMHEHNPACGCCDSASNVSEMIDAEIYAYLGASTLLSIENNDPEPARPEIECPECITGTPKHKNYLNLCCRCQGTRVTKDYTAWSAWNDNRYEITDGFYKEQP